MDDNYDTMSLKGLKQYCRDKKYKGHSKCRTKNDITIPAAATKISLFLNQSHLN